MRTNSRAGMALPIVISVIFVATAFVFALHKYQSHRVWVTGVTVNDISALASAEAAVSCVLAEVRASPIFATHEITQVNPDGSVTWGASKAWQARVKSGTGLTVPASGNGTYAGTVGTGDYQAEFKVRAGYLPDLSTNASNSQGGGEKRKRYLYVEAIGKREDPTGRTDRATKVRVMIERINFSEFLIYDGGWVTLGMGSTNDQGNFNIFADGRIYGQQWVHLGDISQNGTKQRFINLTSIRSAGPIKAQSPYKIYFQAPRTADGQPSPDPGFEIDLDSSNDSDGPGTVETGRGRILDGANGGEIEADKFEESDYTSLQSYLTVNKPPVSFPWYSNSGLDALQVTTIDFGRARYQNNGANGDDGTPEGLGQPYPANFSGVIYVPTGSVMVWGNPDRDVTIVSTEHIFISGDFNSRETFPQNYQEDFVSEVSENDQKAMVPRAPYYTYKDPEKFVDDQGRRVQDQDADRRACAMIAQGRIWRDYRLPGRALQNELVGLMAWELAEVLVNSFTVTPAPAPNQEEVEWKKFVSQQDTGLNLTLVGFSATPGAAVDGVPALFPGLQAFDRFFPLTKSDQDDSDAPRRKSPGSSTLVNVSSPQAIAAAAQSGDLPQYLRSGAWYVTKDTKIKINELLNQEFAASGGQITHQLLWGNGDTDPGLLWKIYDFLLEDEEHYGKYLGIGFPNKSPAANSSRLALANAPQRLYNLVRDENGLDPLDVLEASGTQANPDIGPKSDKLGTDLGEQDDRLYYPQQTINAMLFSYGLKDSSKVPGGVPTGGNTGAEADANNVNIVYEELGNPTQKGLKWLGTVSTRSTGSGNIITPMIQRIRGSVIDFQSGTPMAPAIEGFTYYPPIRRRIYDPDLALYPPPEIPTTAKTLSWFNMGATPAEFDQY